MPDSTDLEGYRQEITHAIDFGPDPDREELVNAIEKLTEVVSELEKGCEVDISSKVKYSEDDDREELIYIVNILTRMVSELEEYHRLSAKNHMLRQMVDDSSGET